MAKFGNLGVFAGGIAGGLERGATLKRQESAEKRAKEEHQINQRIKKIGLGRLEREDPLHQKEVQLRGMKIEYDQTEQGFLNSMQEFEQGTRRLLAQGGRTQAQTAVTAAGAAAERQPDELTVAREELNRKVADAMQRQTATMWDVLRLGDKKLAVDLYNKSKLIEPGEKAKDFRIDDVEATDAQGKKVKTQVLTVVPEKEGAPPKQIPIATLETLRNRYGAKYEKVGTNIVRVGPDGKVSSVYEADAFAHTGEGDIYNKGTGQIAAQGGLGGSGRPTGATRAQEKHIDARVKMAIDKVIMPRFGGRFEGGLFFPDEANKDVATRATELAGQLIRGGMDPERAGVQAVEQAEREKALKDAASKEGGGGGYTGPRPWQR